jgi:predicted HicB family RNase H-like nuclease
MKPGPHHTPTKEKTMPPKREKNRPDGTVAVRLDLPETDHARLRVEAAKRGVSMATMTRDLVIRWLDEVSPLPKSRKKGKAE